jgi:hypothetical protein
MPFETENSGSRARLLRKFALRGNAAFKRFTMGGDSHPVKRSVATTVVRVEEPLHDLTPYFAGDRYAQLLKCLPS